ILRWLKKEGETVAKGDAVAEIETDKVSIEIEAFAGGVLAKILHGEGETVPVGDPIAVIAEPGEKVEAPAASGNAKVGQPAAKHEQGAGEAGEALSERAAERKNETLPTPSAAPAAPGRT